MTKRKRKHVSRPSAAEYAMNVQRRVIEVLLAVAPDAPIPRPLLEAIISTDSLVAGPSLSIADNLALAPSVVDTTVEHAEDLRQLITDMARGTFVVTAARQQRLRALFAILEATSQAKQRRRDDLTEVQDAMLAEMHVVQCVFKKQISSKIQDAKSKIRSIEDYVRQLWMQACVFHDLNEVLVTALCSHARWASATA